MAPSTRSARCIVTALLVVLVGAGCVSDEEESRLPVRVNPLPAGVEGLGPAVFAVRVDDERRTDLIGLVSVPRFGDEIVDVPPARRHSRIALGDPTTPTIAEGLGEDPRDAVLAGGRLIEATLPEDAYADRVFRLGPGRSWTESRCLIVGTDGAISRPAAEARCTATRDGGLTWQARDEPRYGGIDPTTGAPTGPIPLPDHPIAASSDGRYLATVTRDRPGRLILGDLERGTSTPTVNLLGGPATADGVFTADGYATLHRPGDVRELIVVRPDGTVRTLLSPVGEVAFAPNGRFALVVDTRAVPSRLAVVDLPAGTVRQVTDAVPIDGRVVATVTGSQALVTEIRAVDFDIDPDAARPARVWAVDLATGRQREVTTVAAVTSADVTGRTAGEWSAGLSPGGPNPAGGPNPTGGPGPTAVPDPTGGSDPVSERAAGEPAGLRFAPGGETVSVTAGGTVTVAPPDAVPRLGLPNERVLHLLASQGDGRTRHDRLSVIDARGGSVEIDTGADEDQRINGFVSTPDGQHLLVSLRPASGGYPNPGPRDEIVLVRLDGTEPPLVLYRGAVLASLGTDAAPATTDTAPATTDTAPDGDGTDGT